jgi:hypothetical protein
MGPGGNMHYYPPIALTIFVIIATCTGAGLAVGMMAWAIFGEAAVPGRNSDGLRGPRSVAGGSPGADTRHDEDAQK